MKILLATLACLLLLVLPLGAADPIAGLIGRRTGPLEHCREWLRTALAVEGLLPRQRQFIDKLQKEMVGIGAAREIKIGGRLQARRIPVYLRDGRSVFLTLAVSGRVLAMPSIPLPHYDIFLLPAEWNSLRRSPLQLPADRFVLPDRGTDLPPFPIHTSIRGDFEEPVGIAADADRLPNFYFLPGAFAIPGRDIRENAVAVVEIAGTMRRLHYRPREREDALVSLPAVAAMAADWWRIASSGSREVIFRQQRNPLSGEIEYGTPWWPLYDAYQTAADTDPVGFPREALLRDPVLDLDPPCSLEAFVRMLQKRQLPAAECRPLFSLHGGNFPLLEEALRRDGVILAGIAPRRDGIPMRHPLFGVLVVGAGRIGSIPLVACREALPGDMQAGSAPVRLLPLDFLAEAWQFSHTLDASLTWDWRNQELHLQVRVRGGDLTDPSEIEARFDNESRSFSFRRAGVGAYHYRVPRTDLGRESPSYTVRLRRQFFRGETADGWIVCQLSVR